MGYELNVEAYSKIIQIEVGIREYFIHVIQQFGIEKWFSTFLGNVQRDTLAEVSRRILLANKNNEYPAIEDQYLFKLHRAKREEEQSLRKSSLCHPFYYLNWSDMDAIMRLKSNIVLLDRSIGKDGREVIVDILRLLSAIRNDIAHSRFISDKDLLIITSCRIQIESIIPQFCDYVKSQSTEDQVSIIVQKIKIHIEKINSNKLIEANEIESFIEHLNFCTHSFWFNSMHAELLININALRKALTILLRYRNLPGGLLKILKWKKEHNQLITSILNEINHGEL